MQIKYSVVIPLKNEESNVVDLINELEPIMDHLGEPWELICINDGSTDKTYALLLEMMLSKKYLRVISFDRSYGQSSGFDAGFRAAKGEYVITMDGDLQNDPADIPKLIHEQDNADLICGRRVNRKDTLTKKITSKIANFIRSRICRDGVNDTGCSLKLYRKSCLDKIRMYHGMHRFLPALFTIEGFRVKEVPVNHRERLRGKTKYNFLNRSFNTIADLFAVNWMRKRRLHYKIEKQLP